tara:strand:- start:52 stop:219 length:168 start_codon:yes stop_codon:yes gene_type:complete
MKKIMTKTDMQNVIGGWITEYFDKNATFKNATCPTGTHEFYLNSKEVAYSSGTFA